MLGRGQFEVNMDAGKSQVTSKHESESQAQCFALADSGAGVDSAWEQKKLKATHARNACKSPRLPHVRCITKNLEKRI